MTIIGVTGGSSLCELGSIREVQLFFECLENYVVQRYPEIDWKVLTDRFYKRYVRDKEVELAAKRMLEVQDFFRRISSQSIDWNGIDIYAEETRIKVNASNLAEVFEVFFECFHYCCESAKLNFEEFRDCAGYQYEPVRLVIVDQPWFTIEKIDR